jgi:hypothetical protein
MYMRLRSSARYRLGSWQSNETRSCDQGVEDGHRVPFTAKRLHSSYGSWLPILLTRLSENPASARVQGVDAWKGKLLRQAEMAIFEYINGFYNPRRGHSVLAGKARSLSNGKWPKRALGAALKRERSRRIRPIMPLSFLEKISFY